MKITILILSYLSLLNPIATFAKGGSMGGNGGTGWVCRETTTHNVRWVKLLDTFEAKADPRIHASFSSDITSALEIVSQRLKQVGVENDAFINVNAPYDSSSDSKNCPYFSEKINCGWAASEAATILPLDASTIFRPAPEDCADGNITREAVALRTNGRNVILVPSLYKHLSPVDKVALALHESFYTFASFIDKTENSDSVRPLVAKFVSDEPIRLTSVEKKSLKRWSSVDLQTTYWVEFEFTSWADSGWVILYFGDTVADFEFKKNECEIISKQGIVMGHPTARFLCKRLAKILFYDASDTPNERLVLQFPDQMEQAVTKDFKFIVDGIDGNFVDYAGQVHNVRNQRAPFFNELITLKNIWENN